MRLRRALHGGALAAVAAVAHVVPAAAQEVECNKVSADATIGLHMSCKREVCIAASGKAKCFTDVRAAHG
jgi:hypothetical protein